MAGRFTVEARFNGVDHLSRTINRMQSRMERFTRGVTTGARMLGKLGVVAGTALVAGAALGTAALYKTLGAINEITDKAGDLADRSARLKFPVEELQTWAFAAEQSGVENEVFNKSLDGFVKRLGEAKNGTGALTSAFKKSNPDLLKQLKGTKNTAEAFDLYIRALRAVKDPAQRAAMANAAFGRAGAQMSQIASESAESVAALRAEALANGVVTTKQAKDSEAYGDAMNNLKRAVTGFLQGALLPLVPRLTELADKTRAWILANKGLIASRVEEYFVKVKGFVIQVKENLPAIVMWLKRIGVAVAAFYAFALATHVANTALMAFEVATKIAALTGRGYSAVLAMVRAANIAGAASTVASTVVTWAGTAATWAKTVALRVGRIATTRLTAAMVISSAKTLADTVVSYASAAATWVKNTAVAAYTAVVGFGSKAVALFTLLTSRETIAAGLSAAATWIKNTAQAAHTAVLGLGTTALGVYRSATMLATGATAASAAATGAATASFAPFLLAVAAAAAAVAALAAAWDQWQKLDKQTGGLGVGGTVTKMIEKGTFDPFAVIDEHMNEQAKAAASRRTNEGGPSVSPAEPGATVATPQVVSSNEKTLRSIEEKLTVSREELEITVRDPNHQVDVKRKKKGGGKIVMPATGGV